jgi:hypothetical protein
MRGSTTRPRMSEFTRPAPLMVLSLPPPPSLMMLLVVRSPRTSWEHV